MSVEWIGAARRTLPRSFRPARRRTVTVAAPLIALLCLYLLFQTASPPSKPPPPPRTYHYAASSFNWSSFEPHHQRKAAEQAVLPTGKPAKLPRVQFDFPHSATAGAGASTLALRRQSVKEAFEKSWASYKEQAWTWDELKPVRGGGRNTFGGLAATLVDALDTLWIMDMKKDFYEAVEVVARLDFSNITGNGLNVFETTIRHLGGMLSAYDLSGEEVLLRKATELGDMLYIAFDTPNHLPGFWFIVNDALKGRQKAGTNEPSASPGSLSLEFTRLAQLTGDSKYYSAIDRVTNFLETSQSKTKLPGMWPTMLNFASETATNSDFTLGGLADSLYEYLPKMHILLGGREPKYEKMYRAAIAVVERELLFRPMLPDADDILFSGNVVARGDKTRLVPEAQHLGCFIGGMFALAGRLFKIDHHVAIGDRIARGCVWAYDAFPLGIMPEVFHLVACDSRDVCAWDEEKWTKEGHSSSKKQLPKGVKLVRDSRYILRPEAIESLFVLYRVTGEPEYRDMAWTMFEAIRAATETELAFTALADVTIKESAKMDSMESFWMAETLKYLYLIFSPPGVISLDEYVFNTEAHPFKRP